MTKEEQLLQYIVDKGWSGILTKYCKFNGIYYSINQAPPLIRLKKLNGKAYIEHLKVNYPL